MFALIMVIAILAIFVIPAIKRSMFGGAIGSYSPKGTPARAILLRVDAIGTRIPASPVAFESRSAFVDVEIPGQAPYEVNAVLTFPANLRGDVLPGATVDVRVNLRDKTRITVVGPAIGTALLNASTTPPAALPARKNT